MKNFKLFEPLVNTHLPRLVYCGDDCNLPPLGMQVSAFIHKTERHKSLGLERQHTVMIEAYWMEEYGKAVWYVGGQQIKVPVVAWIYIPEDYTISSEKLFKLAKLGDMPL